MTEPELKDLLDHVSEAANDAIEFIADMSKEKFASDKKTQRAVVFSLQVIGEASARILKSYPRFAEVHASIPWSAMRGMRNRIVHGYFVIDFDVVWKTVEDDLPHLLVALERIER